VVVKADTIVNPWAVMIHLEYTHSADPAMMAPVWLVLVAPLAFTSVSSTLFLQWIEDTCLKHIFFSGVIDPFWRIWNTPRVHSYTSKVAEHEKQGNAVKNYPLPHTTKLGIMVSQLGR